MPPSPVDARHLDHGRADVERDARALRSADAHRLSIASAPLHHHVDVGQQLPVRLVLAAVCADPAARAPAALSASEIGTAPRFERCGSSRWRRASRSACSRCRRAARTARRGSPLERAKDALPEHFARQSKIARRMLLVSDSISAASRSISGEVTGVGARECAQHVAHGVHRLGVDFRARHAERLVDRLDDDLVGADHAGDHAPSRRSAPPPSRAAAETGPSTGGTRGRCCTSLEAELVEILARQLAQHPRRGDVLDRTSPSGRSSRRTTSRPARPPAAPR